MMCIEPGLQPVQNKTLTGASANCQYGAWLDTAASGSGVGPIYERTFFDVRLLNPYAPRIGTSNSCPAAKSMSR